MKMPRDDLDTRLFAPCGMNCMVCYRYVSRTKPCVGCLNADVGKPAHCRKCRIKDCVSAKGCTHCYACSDYPCSSVKNLDKSYRMRYGVSLLENSRFVKLHGLAAFMKRQKQIFTCPECGGVFSLHDKECSECGRKTCQISEGCTDSIITLREFTDADMPLFKTWLYAPHVAKWYRDPKDWIHEIEKRRHEFSWLHHFMADQGGRSIGFCQYYACADAGEAWYGGTDIDGTYSIDYLIGEASFLGKGLGRAMIGELIRLIRAKPGARRIIVQPEPENTASCRTLLSCGFGFDAADALYRLEL